MQNKETAIHFTKIARDKFQVYNFENKENHISNTRDLANYLVNLRGGITLDNAFYSRLISMPNFSTIAITKDALKIIKRASTTKIEPWKIEKSADGEVFVSAIEDEEEDKDLKKCASANLKHHYIISVKAKNENQKFMTYASLKKQACIPEANIAIEPVDNCVNFDYESEKNPYQVIQAIVDLLVATGVAVTPDQVSCCHDFCDCGMDHVGPIVPCKENEYILDCYGEEPIIGQSLDSLQSFASAHNKKHFKIYAYDKMVFDSDATISRKAENENKNVFTMYLYSDTDNLVDQHNFKSFKEAEDAFLNFKKEWAEKKENPALINYVKIKESDNNGKVINAWEGTDTGSLIPSDVPAEGEVKVIEPTQPVQEKVETKKEVKEEATEPQPLPVGEKKEEVEEKVETPEGQKLEEKVEETVEPKAEVKEELEKEAEINADPKVVVDKIETGDLLPGTAEREEGIKKLVNDKSKKEVVEDLKDKGHITEKEIENVKKDVKKEASVEEYRGYKINIWQDPGLGRWNYEVRDKESDIQIADNHNLENLNLAQTLSKRDVDNMREHFDPEKKAASNLISVTVTYDNGDIITTDVNGNQTDEQIRQYFKVGKEFNLGNGEEDKLAKVVKVDIDRGNIEKESKVVKQDGKYQAQSEKGKNFGTYDTKEEAKERVKQMEMFKHMDKKSEDKEDIEKEAEKVLIDKNTNQPIKPGDTTEGKELKEVEVEKTASPIYNLFMKSATIEVNKNELVLLTAAYNSTMFQKLAYFGPTAFAFKDKDATFIVDNNTATCTKTADLTQEEIKKHVETDPASLEALTDKELQEYIKHLNSKFEVK